jgi:hypothetical protein
MFASIRSNPASIVDLAQRNHCPFIRPDVAPPLVRFEIQLYSVLYSSATLQFRVMRPALNLEWDVDASISPPRVIWPVVYSFYTLLSVQALSLSISSCLVLRSLDLSGCLRNHLSDLASSPILNNFLNDYPLGLFQLCSSDLGFDHPVGNFLRVSTCLGHSYRCVWSSCRDELRQFISKSFGQSTVCAHRQTHSLHAPQTLGKGLLLLGFSTHVLDCLRWVCAWSRTAR